jgi:hypothetical protein
VDTLKAVIGSIVMLMLAALAFFYIFFVGGQNGTTYAILTEGPAGIAKVENSLMGAGAAGAYGGGSGQNAA